MSLFLLKSDHDREQIGDVFVPIEKICSIRAIQAEKTFCIILTLIDGQDVKAWFKDKNNFTKQLSFLIDHYTVLPDIIDDLVLTKTQDRKSKLKELLNKVVNEEMTEEILSH